MMKLWSWFVRVVFTVQSRITMVQSMANGFGRCFLVHFQFGHCHNLEFQFVVSLLFAGDEEPMESQHADHNRIRVRLKHCMNQQVAMLHGVHTLLVRNNVNCCITAGKLRDQKGEED